MEDMVDNSLANSENENVIENTNLGEEEGLGDGDSIVLEVGMQFNNEKAMFEFYKRYAYDPQPTTQTDCKARISASSDVNGTWRINIVNLEHNHTCSPSKSRFYRCNRKLPAHVKRKLEVNDMAGIPLLKSFNSTVVETSGYENLPCVEKDYRNYIEQVRRLLLGEGDAATIQSYFSKMQARCLGFYFSIDLDDESRLKNVFWTDNRCKHACREFDDVVTFNSTYLTNKYDMPFAPFVGVNYHDQSTLLGCGLLSNEDTYTFFWLFKTWLEYMHGQAPHGIVTDQDRAMQNAIQIAGTEFEGGWGLMIDEYEYKLHDNDWLAGLYNNIACWVPCFLKTTFWAVTTPAQLRYNDMCHAFSQLADLTTDDEGQSRAIMGWIKCQYKELTLTKSSNGSNAMSQPAVHLPS
ncbi:protein FAR-RED IMPAIRED RESPONSE 1-like [Olea europaea var. sylvestris]|uniref:protein FAR-RED IMPAIRED RESPONSE 1-like n=1 Tax=Olea europaea var. sylvestris TaxID=158386 RepID=UPI000C1D29F0|nr:protein FAR-RED IMPAIRED RESPONSE 1-like [Olea europaea var. sylvestris]